MNGQAPAVPFRSPVRSALRRPGLDAVPSTAPPAATRRGITPLAPLPLAGLLFRPNRPPAALPVPPAERLDSHPPLPAANDVDHYACHRLRLVPDGPFALIEDVRLTDQFGTRYLDLTTPRHLCAPVSNNGAGIKNPGGYFLCYRVQLSVAAPQDALGPARELHTNNEFGPRRLAAIRQAELCVPSVRTPG